ncbi:MAG: aminodeoxychorismate/anthranilate synthase component II, partial [Euryarchaeota archaeon]|nr:aminodeoxychorismate/anthranilate synthase component II [Euryarchaeota archaeon]MBT5726785.1 aminodeoxychorismate/anthranilate synthase component II [Euryarchaeota archaeon]
ALGLAAGMELIKVPTGPVHGSPRSIRHSDGRLFEGFTSPHSFTLYNSLVLTNEGASSLNQVAWNETTGDIMGVQHPEKQIFGVQFHPESVGSENGINVLSNFLGMRADA